MGHTLIPPYPVLVGLKTEEKWTRDISGLALKNVRAKLSCGHKAKELFGEMEFTHFGVSGPIILTLSHFASLWLQAGKSITLEIDLKPALSEAKLDDRIRRDFHTYQRKQLKNGLRDLLPRNLVPIIIELSGIDPDKIINQITKEERLCLVRLLKALPLSVKDTLPITAAIVTGGGVDLKEINPKTMESKLIPGLYFAGEVINIHGITGGFNLQAAFSTGVLAELMPAKGNLIEMKGGSFDCWD